MPKFDFDNYDDNVESSFGPDPLREDAFEDNVLMLQEARMTEDEWSTYHAWLREREAPEGGSPSVADRIVATEAARGESLPDVGEMFERLCGGGFIDEVDFYRIMFSD